MPKPLAEMLNDWPINAKPAVVKAHGRWIARCSMHGLLADYPTWKSAYAHARGHSQAAHRPPTGDQTTPAEHTQQRLTEHTGRAIAEARLDRARQALTATGNAVNAARAEHAAALAAIDRLNQQDTTL